MLKLFTLIIISVFSFQLQAFGLEAKDTQYIRAAIIQDAASLRLKVDGFFQIEDLMSHKVLYRGKHINTTVTVQKGDILLGPVRSKSNKLIIKAEDPDAILIDGRMFRGDIQFIRKDNQHLLVVNNISLEDYIKGILYHEASHYWPQEALKAQAIASRTYALYQMESNKTKNYDVTSDIFSQVYGGRTSERYRTNKIVEDTKGLALLYQGKIFPAYFHATCAGHTEDASLLWNTDLAPLKGVACIYCKESPHFNWHEVLSLDEIEKKLMNSDYQISKIEDITIDGRDVSGRITKLKIISKDNSLEIPAKDFRSLIGPNLIRSANFNLSIVNREAVIEGVGWGHGVGLCQWGAYFMAKEGKNYEEILKYYYPGAEISSTLK